MFVHATPDGAPHNLSRQGGVSLVVVLIILAVVSLLGVAAVQIAGMSVRSARNDRDQQIAWQSAEAALVDAEFDLYGPGPSKRRDVFGDMPDLTAFVEGCGASGKSVGLCHAAGVGRPAWMTVDFEATGAGAPTAQFGAFTDRTFQAGGAGIQPARAPRYIIEAIRDPNDRDLSNTQPKYIYRITAMGFGPRVDIQAVLQMLYRN